MLLKIKTDGHETHCEPSDGRNAVQVLLALHRAGLRVKWWLATEI